MRSFQKQAMMKQQVYINILARQSGVDYSALINFETILVNMDEAKALTKNNQLVKTNQNQVRRCRCGYIKYLRMTSNYCPTFLSKGQKLAFSMGLSLSKIKKSSEYVAAEEEVNSLG